MSVFASLPKSPVIVDGLKNGRLKSLSSLRSNDIVYIRNCEEGSTVVVQCNQRCHQIVLSGCTGMNLFLLDSAVLASRTVSVIGCHGCNIHLEDVDVRRVEVWGSTHNRIVTIGDDVLSEETSVLWNGGCSGNEIVVGDLYSCGEPHDSLGEDQVVPFKVVGVVPIPSAGESERLLTVCRPLQYIHTIPFGCDEAKNVLSFHDRFIPDEVVNATVDSLVPVPLLSTPNHLLALMEQLAANPPQISKELVDAAYDAERVEFRDSEEKIREQAMTVAKQMLKARYIVVFTGAGISTAANIPDFRGPEGIWTMRDKHQKTSGKGLDMPDAFPTFSHYAITQLAREGFVKFVVSTNMDGLHCRSGLPRHLIEELHGSCFTAVCPNCRMKHVRGREFEARHHFRVSHGIGEFCQFCGHELNDTIVNFAETYRDMTQPVIAGFHCRQADFALVLGTSMAVQPAVTFPLKVLSNVGGKMCLVNMQHTPADKAASVRVYSEIDTFMKHLMDSLKITVPTGSDCIEEWGTDEFTKPFL